jgi:tetratricopeptide (TPR) repeat protein/predicted aspartyl protease
MLSAGAETVRAFIMVDHSTAPPSISWKRSNPQKQSVDRTDRPRDHVTSPFFQGLDVRTLLTATIVLAAGFTALPTAAAPKCSVSKMLELPVTMAGLRPMVPAKINGHEVKFLADSGAFYSTISPGSAAELSLKLGPAPIGFRLGGIGGAQDVKVATIQDFGLGTATLHHVQFIVGGSETGSIGLLGQNILGIADVEYDLAAGVLRLMKPHDCEHANLAYWSGTKPYSVLEIESPSVSRLHTEGTVLLNGVKIRAIFDTGAATSILSTSAAARAGVRADDPGVMRAGFTRGLGRKTVATWIGPFQSLKVGDEEIKKIRLRFGDIGNDFDMLIGADFFLSHRVYVSNATHRLFFTYNGGKVFDLSVKEPAPDREPIADAKADRQPGAPAAPTTAAATATPVPLPGEPTTAEEYSRRGAALAARLDFAGALADLTRACDLAPTNPDFRYQRAIILLRSNRRPAAMADLDRTLALKPDNPEVLLTRAGLRLAERERAAAKADVDAAARIVPKPSDMHLQIANLYDTLGEPARATDEYDLWIAAHPDDSRMPNALNGRCWSRTLAGRDLDRAISDCDRALKLRPRTAGFLDSRGLARLRHGDLDKAIADFDAALAINPKLAWSLYGRGLAELKKGQKASGDADIAAAVALRPKLPEEAKKFGIGATTAS